MNTPVPPSHSTAIQMRFSLHPKEWGIAAGNGQADMQMPTGNAAVDEPEVGSSSGS